MDDSCEYWLKQNKNHSWDNQGNLNAKWIFNNIEKLLTIFFSGNGTITFLKSYFRKWNIYRYNYIKLKMHDGKW